MIGCVQADVVTSPVTDLPPPGATLLTGQAAIRVGGAGANAALAAVEAGLEVRLVGCVGDDALGMWMREELRPAGLSDELIVVPGETTGLTVVLESPIRDRTFLTYLGVNAHWDAAMIPEDALGGENLLLCDYFVMPLLRGEPTRGLLSAARSRGSRTFFDTTWDPDGFADGAREEVLSLLPLCDVFLPNEIEACALTGVRDAAAAARSLQAVSGGWVVVKRGAAGCLAVGPGGVELSAPAPAVRVEDTTGAGDAFNAGLLAALARGAQWPDALMSATRFASQIISRPSHDRWALAPVEVQP